jgi:hypothetical protein
MNMMKQTIQNYDVKWNLLNVTPLTALRLPNNRVAHLSIGNHHTHIQPSGHPYNRYVSTQHTSGTGSELLLQCLRRNVRRKPRHEQSTAWGFFCPVHSFCSLPCDKSVASSKAISPKEKCNSPPVTKAYFFRSVFMGFSFWLLSVAFVIFYILTALASLLRHCSKFAPTVALLLKQGCGVGVGVVESESEGLLGGVGVGKNVPTPTPTSI